MLTGRGWAAIIAGVVAYGVAWGFGAAVLVPLAIALVVGPTVALVLIRRREAAPLRLIVGVVPARPVEGADVALSARIIGHGPRSGEVRLRVAGREASAPLRLDADGGAVATIGIQPLARGVHSVTQGELASGDPFGFARDRRALQVATSVVVWPTWEEPVRDPAGGDGEGDVARVRRRVQPVGYDLHGIREHAYGESLRRVDWKTTARTGRLMVREIEDDAGSGLAIIVDLDANLLTGAAADAAMRAAATVVRGATARAERATLVLVGARVDRLPLEGPTAWRDAMDALAAARADRTRPLAAIADRDAGVLRADAVTLVTAASGAALDAVLERLGAHVPVRVVRVGADGAFEVDA